MSFELVFMIKFLLRSKKDPEDHEDGFYLSKLNFLGRIYDFETDNEHLVTAFQQFIDQTLDSKEFSNVSSSLSFANIVSRVWLIKLFVLPLNWLCSFSWHQDAKICLSDAFSKAEKANACCSTKWWSSGGMLWATAALSITFTRVMITQCEWAIECFCFSQFDVLVLSRNRPYFSDVTGPDMGLILVVNNTSDDYFYNILNTMGFSVCFSVLYFIKEEKRKQKSFRFKSTTTTNSPIRPVEVRLRDSLRLARKFLCV